jgi:hypothetical protein
MSQVGTPIKELAAGAWCDCLVTGAVQDFAPVLPDDEYLHPVAADAHFTTVETNLYGFNIPEADINCNIYVLWHPVLRTMSVHIWVLRGKRIVPHQLAADYFVEHLFLPAVENNADWSVTAGSSVFRIKIVRPLEEILIQVRDDSGNFALDLTCIAALPPVGRPGGHHFTQLLKTRGTLTLDGAHYAIDGHYMRDRSWGYNRPELAERTPPYRWMTGWFEGGSSFVIAWFDTGLLDDPEFGPHWNSVVDGPDASGANKWESGGPTPSLNLRSGWITTDGRIVPVTSLRFRTLTGGSSRFIVKAVEIEITDADGRVHLITGETQSMIPKLYWGNLSTNMHAMKLRMGEREGAGDLMDTYSGHHIARYGL